MQVQYNSTLIDFPCLFPVTSITVQVDDTWPILNWPIQLKHKLKPGSQYDARASVAMRASGWHWNRLDFYSSVASWALASVQPIRLSKNLTSAMQFDWWKRLFSLTLTTLVMLAVPASYCEPGFTQHLKYDNNYKYGDEEDIPSGGGGSSGSSGWSESHSSEELLESDNDLLGGGNWSFWPLPSVTSCRIKCVHKNSNSHHQLGSQHFIVNMEILQLL